jgi:anti-sigma B factor antagonist
LIHGSTAAKNVTDTSTSRERLAALPITWRKDCAREMDFNFRIHDGPVDAQTYAVEPQGELDLATAPDLAAALDAAIDSGRRLTVLDLAEVRFLGSTALRVILRARRGLEERGGRLVIVSSDPFVARVFEITGLLDILSVTSSRREALSWAAHVAPAV